MDGSPGIPFRLTLAKSHGLELCAPTVARKKTHTFNNIPAQGVHKERVWVGEASCRYAMAPLLSRLDEVLSAGLAHMRLAPTGMQSGKRNQESYLEDLENELQIARKRHQAHEEEEQKLFEWLEPVKLDSLTSKVNETYRKLTPRQKETLDKRLAKAAAAREIEEELFNDELFNDELFREYLDGLEAAERLHADEVLEPLDDTVAQKKG